MTTQPTTPEEVAHVQRLADVGRRYLRGATQMQIAADLKVHQSTISRDLTEIRELWLGSALISFDEAKARELAKIDNLEAEYWDAWTRSKQERTIHKQTIDVEKGRPSAVSVETTSYVGDKVYLEGVQWCITQRCKILGLEAPEKKLVGVSVIAPAAVQRLHQPDASAMAHQLLALLAEEVAP